jgi:hypothetical protein
MCCVMCPPLLHDIRLKHMACIQMLDMHWNAFYSYLWSFRGNEHVREFHDLKYSVAVLSMFVTKGHVSSKMHGGQIHAILPR